MSIWKQQVNSSSNFVSFFIVMTHDSSINFKHILFLLWIKGSHQSCNFETFKCSGENLPYSHHFPNHKPVFLQILHHSSVLWKITRASFWDFLVLKSTFTKVLSFWKQQISFSSHFASIFRVMRHNPSVLFQLKFCIHSTKGAYWSITLVKFYVSSQKFEISSLMGSFCPNHAQFQLKRYRVISHITEVWCKV